MVGQISITTTSNNGAWTPGNIIKTGNDLTWSATNAVIGTIVPTSQTGSIPTFDFSGNNGTPIVITAASTDGFTGLTDFRLPSLDITSAVLLEGTSVLNLFLYSNLLTSLDISQNISLTRLQLQNNSLVSLDISQNTLLTELIIKGNNIPSLELDAIVNQLDANGLSNGKLEIVNNAGGLTSAALTGFNNLIGKGWTIDVPTPPLGPETITLSTTSSLSSWTLGRFDNNYGSILHWEAVGSGITTQEFDENRPTFDFSSNINNLPITITITSDDGFV